MSLNLLSINSGGCRSVLSLKLLMQIEEITGKPIYEIFDYYGASSAGCLVSSGLLLSEDGEKAKFTAHQLFDIFYNNLTNCFSWTYSSYILSGFGLFGPLYDQIGLKKTINDCCGDAKLGQLLKPIVFPTYDKISNKNYYFCKHKNKDLLVADVVLGCTAAPTYFASHQMKIDNIDYDFVDSGLVSQTSLKLVLLEAIKNKHIHKEKILCLNVGTGIFDLPKANYSGLLSWAPHIVQTMMNATYENEIFELSLILPKEHFFIMDVPLDVKYYQLDNIKPEAIKYYLDETDKWIASNKDAIVNFCDKLMLNKGFY
jgi:patatin-like phospholipase/acyl hydrolase